MRKDFNMVIVGIGGQGLITLTKLLAEAALMEGHDIKTSELHGLSQRGGSVETLIRFGRKIYSPLVRQGGADLIIALEAQEALKSCYYASEDKTMFLVNNDFKSIPGKELPNTEDVIEQLEKFAKRVIIIAGTHIAKEKLEKKVLVGVLLISSAIAQGLIPLKADSLLKVIKKQIPERYLEMNIKAFKLGQII